MSPDRLIRFIVGPPVRSNSGDRIVAWSFPLPDKGEEIRSLDLYSYRLGDSGVAIWHEKKGQMSVNTRKSALIAAVVALLPPKDRAEFFARKMIS